MQSARKRSRKLLGERLTMEEVHSIALFTSFFVNSEVKLQGRAFLIAIF